MRNAALLVLGWSIAGYEFMALVCHLLGIETFIFSVAFRAFFAALSLVGFLYFARTKVSLGSIGFFFFWIFYLIRLVYDTGFSGKSFYYDSNLYYLSWAIGACLLPALFLNRFFASGVFDVARRSFCFNFSLLSVSGLGVLYVFQYGVGLDATGQEIFGGGRLELSSLNPIAMGYLGLNLLLLSLWFIIRVPSSLKNKLGAFSLGLIGFLILLLTSSRGPILAGLICLVFMLLLSGGVARLWALIVSAIIATIIVPISIFVEDTLGYPAYSRVFGLTRTGDESTDDRLDRYSAVFERVFQSPLFGHGIEIDQYIAYPHNAVLEAFLATGIFGGLLFTILVVYGLYAAARIYIDMPRYGWISLMYLSSVIGAQFTGALYTLAMMWASLGALLGLIQIRQAQTPVQSQVPLVVSV